MKKVWIILLAVSMLPLSAAFANEEASEDFDAKYNAVLSRLQSMGHGYYTAQEWAEAEQSVNELMDDASKRKDGNAIVKAAVIKAMVLGDMRRLHEEAVLVLRDARKAVRKIKDVDASPLYVKEAELLADAGKPGEIRAVIGEYKSSKYYDPQPYAWSGATKPGDPLVLTRPGTADKSSLPLSVMESALVRAASGFGTVFPEAVLTTIDGRQFMTSSLRGRVVLVDFFARGWKSWEDDRAVVQQLYRSYHTEKGLEVLSICLERNPSGLEFLDVPGLLVAGAPDVARQLGVFGDRTTFVLNKNGQILVRNLRGQDLIFAVRSALEE